MAEYGTDIYVPHEYGGTGASAGSSYREGLTGLGKGLGQMFVNIHKQREAIRTVQGVLDAAKTIQTTDPKSGKQKPFFQDDQINAIQRLLDQGNWRAAGAQEAIFGMTKGVAQQVQRADALNRLIQGGPITRAVTTYDDQGNPITRNYRLSTTSKGMSWVPDTAIPRDPYGRTANQVVNENLRVSAQKARALAAREKSIDAMLKPYKLTRGDLFDPASFESGTLDKGKFTPIDSGDQSQTQNQPLLNQIFNAVGSIGAMSPSDLPSDNTAEAPPQDVTPTHFRIGRMPPEYDEKQRPIKGTGSQGVILSKSQIESFQNEAAKMAPPIVSYGPDGQPTGSQTAVQALQWLRQNPDADPALRASVQEKLVGAITQGAARTVQPQADVTLGTGEDQSDQDTQDEEQ